MNKTNSKNPGFRVRYFNDVSTKGELMDTSYDAMRAINSLISKCGFMSFTINPNVTLKMKDSYTAYAKINKDAKEDVFDKDVGYSVVKKKVLDKYHYDFDNCIRVFVNDLRTLLARTEKYCERHNINLSMVPTVESEKVRIFDSGKNRPV